MINNALYLSEDAAMQTLIAVRERLHELDKRKASEKGLFHEQNIETLVLVSEGLSDILKFYRRQRDEKA